MNSTVWTTAPTKVNNLDVFRINGSSLVVVWNPPTNVNFTHGDLQGFAVYTCDFYTANCTYNRTIYNVSDLTLFNASYNYSLLVRGLRPCTNYSFAVSAITGGVEGVVSQTVSSGTGVRSMPWNWFSFYYSIFKMDDTLAALSAVTSSIPTNCRPPF